MGLVKCLHCGQEFKMTNGRKYCSDRCRDRASITRKKLYADGLPPKVCKICGKEFAPKAHTQVCCSRECTETNSLQAKKERRKAYKACKWCGVYFIPETDKQAFCSDACEAMATQKVEEYSREKAKAKSKSLSKYVAEANKLGLSYGQYYALKRGELWI